MLMCTSKQRILVVASIASSLVIVLGCVAISSSRVDRITQFNFDRLQIGMTESQVQRILGGPEGLHAERAWKSYSIGISKDKLWYGEFGIAFLEFDQSGRLISKYFEKRPTEGNEVITAVMERLVGWCHFITE